MDMQRHSFEEFKHMATVSMEEICREIFMEKQASIKIKKEAVAVKNLANIFNTALRLSNEKGFQSMSLRDLSRTSGLSMGALYSYFTSKEELLEMIQNQGRRLTRKVLTQQIDVNTEPVEMLRTAIRVHLYLTEIMQKWFYFSYMETKNLVRGQQKKSIESELETEQVFIDILDEGARRNQFFVKNSVLTASVIKAMLQDWYVKRWKYARRQISVDEYARFVIEFVESALTINSNESYSKEGVMKKSETIVDEPTGIREGEELENAAVESFLKDTIPGLDGSLSIRQFPSGFSNLTYFIRVGDREMVLRRPPFGKKAKTAHDMNREYQILSALHPVFPYCPKPLAYTEDQKIMGCSFYVMERIPGIIFRKDLPEGMAFSADQARALCENMIDLHYRLHTLDYQAIGLGDFGKPEGIRGPSGKGMEPAVSGCPDPGCPGF